MILKVERRYGEVHQVYIEFTNNSTYVDVDNEKVLDERFKRFLFLAGLKYKVIEKDFHFTHETPDSLRISAKSMSKIPLLIEFLKKYYNTNKIKSVFDFEQRNRLENALREKGWK